MAKNEIKEPEIEITEEVKDAPQQPAKNWSFLRGVHSIFDGTILTRQSVIRGLPFLFYIAFLAVLYIGNAYYAEKKIMQIEKIKKEIKELRSESISVKSALMFHSKQSEVIKRISGYGIKESLIPPHKIFVDIEISKAVAGK